MAKMTFLVVVTVNPTHSPEMIASKIQQALQGSDDEGQWQTSFGAATARVVPAPAKNARRRK